MVGTSDRNFWVSVPLPTSQLPYRKAMVVDLFFGTMKRLALDSAFSSTDLIATTAGYFGFNTSSAEDEATVASAKVRATIYNVDHLTGLGLCNRKGDTVSFDPTGVRPKDLRYFAFRSMFMVSAIDIKGPDSPFYVEFVLRLPQTLISTANSISLSNNFSLSPPTKTPDRMAAINQQIEDTDFGTMSAVDICTMFKSSMSATLSSPVDTPKRAKTTSGPVANLFGTLLPGSPLTAVSPGTPKIDGVFAASSERKGTTYHGTLDFLGDGNQSTFFSIFDTDPLPVTLIKAKHQQLAVEKTDKLRHTISSFTSYCQLIIFCNIVHRQYVDASDYDQSQIITDVEEKIIRLKMEFRDRHRIRLLTPDDYQS